MKMNNLTNKRKKYFSLYEPREDSFLLEKNVEILAFGKVLDMGTGTGIQAIAAANNKNSRSVMAADINKEAVLQVLDLCLNKKIPVTVVQSDLFENIEEKFDTIIFNPPYLPDEDEEDSKLCPLQDCALYGGKEGYELTERFLIQAKNHLTKNGQILLLFSSLTQKNVVDAILKKEGYSFEQIDSMKLDFEELYIYKITHN